MIEVCDVVRDGLEQVSREIEDLEVGQLGQGFRDRLYLVVGHVELSEIRKGIADVRGNLRDPVVVDVQLEEVGHFWKQFCGLHLLGIELGERVPVEIENFERIQVLDPVGNLGYLVQGCRKLSNPKFVADADVCFHFDYYYCFIFRICWGVGGGIVAFAVVVAVDLTGRGAFSILGKLA